MKKNKYKSIKVVIMMMGIIFINNYVNAQTFTAVASGAWNNSATWGGAVPPHILGSTEQVTISSGLTVTLDSTVETNGLLAQITVTGTLSSTNAMSLIVSQGTLTGSGTISVGNLILNSGGTFSFSGNATAENLTNSIASLTSTANITVNKTLTLIGVITLQTGGVLNMGNNSVVVVSGGNLALNGGSLGLSATYSVDYISSTTTAGMELSGSGLHDVNINVGGGNSVTLGTNVTVNDSLMLTSGTLVLNGNTLTLNGQVSGSGTISGDAVADIVVNTSGGIVAPVTFTSGYQMINNLTVNVGTGNSVKISGDLTTEGTLTLTSGNLDISGDSLTMNGSFSGSGMLTVNSNSGLIINTAGTIVTPISFSGSLGELRLNTGTNFTVDLGNNLTVTNMLILQTGTLVLNGHNLTISGDIAASGTGNISSSASSDVIVNSSVSTAGRLTFASSGNTVNNLRINVGGGGTVKMGSDIMIQSSLAFTAGHVTTGGHNIQIAAGGTITGANSSSYVITDTLGWLTMGIAATGDSASLLVGTPSYYFPAYIKLNAGSNTGNVSANVSSGVYTHGTTGVKISNTQPMVNATWLFQTNISSNLNYNMHLQWNPATEVNSFVHTSDYISHYTSGAWDAGTQANAVSVSGGMYAIERASLTSMSPFAVFDANTNPTSVNDIVDNAGQLKLYPNPATQSITISNVSGNNEEMYGDIINVCGQVISSFKMNNTNIATIPLSGISEGVYFVKLYNDKTSVIEKFIKVD
jgi:hypothetical protein